VVTTTADSGPGSLRDAINQVNTDTSHTLYPSPGNPSVDEIDFAITAASDTGGGYNSATGVATFTPQTGLPTITDAVTIEGWSQSGFAGTPLIELDGAGAGNASGLVIQAPNTTVRGLVINRFAGDSIAVYSASNTWICGDYLGVDPTGTVGEEGGIGVFGCSHTIIGTNGDGVSDLLERNVIVGPVNGDGIDIRGSSNDVTIQGNYLGTNAAGNAAIASQGDDISAANSITTLRIIGNLISGAYTGISLVTSASLSDVVIQGNRIGTNGAGTASLGNGYGIYMIGNIHNVLIGGTASGAGNLISGNFGGISSYDADSVTIQGNSVGTDVTGSYAIPNQTTGVVVAHATATNVLIGGTVPGAGNLISGNGKQGVYIAETNGPVLVEGNTIGTDRTGAYAIGNGGIGIELIAASGTTIGGTEPAARNLISGNGGGVNVFGGSGNVVEGNFVGTNSSGTTAVPNVGGVAVSGTNNMLTDNLVSGNDGYGIGVGGTMNVIQGNLIGTDVTGNVALANQGPGVIASQYSLIGGPGPGQGNLISGNAGDGIDITYSDSYHNTVQGNRIGTNAAGTAAVGNGGVGVFVYYNHDNLIGGSGPGAGNIISGNRGDGIDITGTTATGNLVQGNSIGTDASGMLHLGNAGFGVFDHGASNNAIGGVGAGQGNTIAYNGRAGVLFEQAASSNTISSNSIHDNGGLGIELDSSANDGQTAPVLTAAISSTTRAGVSGSLTGVANAAYRIEFFSNASPDPSGSGQGQTYLGFTTVTTDGNGHAGFTLSLVNPVPAGQSYVSATATAPDGSTSAFAQDVQATLVPTTTSLSLSLSTPLYGVDSVTFTASVGAAVAGFGSPTGSVQFAVDGTNVGAPVPLSGGVASFTTSTLALGGHTVTATYTGDGGFLTSLGTTTLTVIPPATLSGVVFSDFNNDGQVDFGEKGIAGVPITLTGTDDLGHAVSLSQTTDVAGTYVFLNLRPGSYKITETQQPAGYTPGVASVGTSGGTLSGAQFTVNLPVGVNAMNYNYGEQPVATGHVQEGQTAGIGFWNNKHGQDLIKALNGGTGTQLGDWLAATFPHMFGALSGSNDLAGKNNASVASFFQSRFVEHGQKVDAQVMATALAVYVTNATLDSTGVGTQYGFTVSGNGVGTATYNVGDDGAAFGVANNTTVTVMDLLLSVDAQSVNGVLYNGNKAKRDMANDIFSDINEAGSI